MIALGSNLEEIYIEFTSAELGREKTTINKSALVHLKLIIARKKYLFGVEYQFKKRPADFSCRPLL